MASTSARASRARSPRRNECHDVVTTVRAARDRPARAHVACTRACALLLHVFLITMAIVWLIPIGGALYSSFRPYAETQREGLLLVARLVHAAELPRRLAQGEMQHHFWMTRRSSCIPAVVDHPAPLEHGGVRRSAGSAGASTSCCCCCSPPATCCPRRCSSSRCSRCTSAWRCPASCPTRHGYMLGSKIGHHHHPRRVPDRVLHVRAQQLHEDAAEARSARPR